MFVLIFCDFCGFIPVACRLYNIK